MLRITVVSRTTTEVVLKIEGWVVADELALLEQEGARWLQERQRLVLDLADVRFLDQAALDLLARWSETGVELRGGSLFVRNLLQGRGLTRGPDASPQ